ncbi:MAG: hypothetical protein WCT07_02250 [Candidatus Paceibacterota bacterium]
MQNLISGITLIIARKDSRLVIIVSTVIFFFLLLAAQNGVATKEVLNFEIIPIYKRLNLAFLTFFDIKNTFTSGSLILATLGSLLGGINISLAYTYLRLRGEIIMRSGLYSGIGLFLAFLGVGCAACGTALFSVMLGFFGFSAMLNLLPYQGQEVGYIGLIFLCFATYSLAQKIMAPNVC